MKIGGVMVQRNEGRKAAVVASYHLNRLQFERFTIVDHDSLDDSVAVLEALHDPHIEIIRTPPVGYEQSQWTNHEAGRLFDAGMEVVFLVDADMLYSWRRTDALQIAVQEHPIGFTVPNYHMVPRRGTETNLEGQWWQQITRRKPDPMCWKVVLTRAGWELGFRLGEGNHSLDGGDVPRVGDPVALEYHAICHEDLVRKTITNAVGWLQRLGWGWMHGGPPAHGSHHIENFQKLMSRGHLWPEWNSDRYTWDEHSKAVECFDLADVAWRVGL